MRRIFTKFIIYESKLPPETWMEKMSRSLLTLAAKCAQAEFVRDLAFVAPAAPSVDWEASKRRADGTRKTKINEDAMESKAGRPTRCLELVVMVSVGSDGGGGTTRCDPTNY